MLDSGIPNYVIEGAHRHVRSNVCQPERHVRSGVLSHGRTYCGLVEIAGEYRTRPKAVEVPRIEAIAAGQFKNVPSVQGQTTKHAALPAKAVSGSLPLIEEVNVMIEVLRGRPQPPLDGHNAFVRGSGPSGRQPAFHFDQWLKRWLQGGKY